MRTAGTGRRDRGIAQGAHGFTVLQRVLQLTVKDVPDHIGQAAAGHERAVRQQDEQAASGTAVVKAALRVIGKLQGPDTAQGREALQPPCRAHQLPELFTRETQMPGVLLCRDDHAVEPELVDPMRPAEERQRGQRPPVLALGSEGDLYGHAPGLQPVDPLGSPQKAAPAADAVVDAFGPVQTDLNELRLQQGKLPGRLGVDHGTVGQHRKAMTVPSNLLREGEEIGMGKRFSAGQVDLGLQALGLQEAFVARQSFPEGIRAHLAGVIRLVTVAAAQVAAVRDVPLQNMPPAIDLGTHRLKAAGSAAAAAGAAGPAGAAGAAAARIAGGRAVFALLPAVDDGGCRKGQGRGPDDLGLVLFAEGG